MCGRFASARQTQDLLDAFMIDPTAPLDDGLLNWHAAWNVAPTQGVRIVVERAPESLLETSPAGTDPAPQRSLRIARWGLVPSWAKDPGIGSRMINARSETLLDKPSFAKAAGARRAVVPADGYYEWRALGTGNRPAKQPFYIHPADDSIAAMAGIYEFWRDRTLPDDDPARWLVTVAVITRAAQGDLASIHDRAPVMLTEHTLDHWLNPAAPAVEALQLALSDTPELAWHPVSTRVNTVANDGADLIAQQTTD